MAGYYAYSVDYARSALFIDARSPRASLLLARAFLNLSRYGEAFAMLTQTKILDEAYNRITVDELTTYTMGKMHHSALFQSL